MNWEKKTGNLRWLLQYNECCIYGYREHGSCNLIRCVTVWTLVILIAFLNKTIHFNTSSNSSIATSESWPNSLRSTNIMSIFAWMYVVHDAWPYLRSQSIWIDSIAHWNNTEPFQNWFRMVRWNCGSLQSEVYTPPWQKVNENEMDLVRIHAHLHAHCARRWEI